MFRTLLIDPVLPLNKKKQKQKTHCQGVSVCPDMSHFKERYLKMLSGKTNKQFSSSRHQKMSRNCLTISTFNCNLNQFLFVLILIRYYLHLVCSSNHHALFLCVQTIYCIWFPYTRNGANARRLVYIKIENTIREGLWTQVRISFQLSLMSRIMKPIHKWSLKLKLTQIGHEYLLFALCGWKLCTIKDVKLGCWLGSV